MFRINALVWIIQVPGRHETSSRRDREYEALPGVRETLEAIKSGAPVILVSGRAGTGKSRLIDYISRFGHGRQAVVAPTGVAALGLGATTVHSTFRIPIGGVCDARRPLPQLDAESLALLRGMSRLVIDEISMLRADHLDVVDARLRAARGSPLPFGGVQVIMVGDFLQLPPVTTESDRQRLSLLGYETPWAFSARVLARSAPRSVNLPRVLRQSDPAFISALSSIRDGSAGSLVIDALNDLCHGSHRDGVEPLVIVARRKDAERRNQAALERLIASPARPHHACIRASFAGTLAEERTGSALPVAPALHVAVGSRVMATRNDPAGRFANGSLGTVLDLEEETAGVTVLFDGKGDPCFVEPVEWTERRLTWDGAHERVVSRIVGTAKGLPLAPGHAITAHKAQGLTLDDVRLDLGGRVFEAGQLYVALSRARGIAGLSFASPLQPHDVLVDNAALAACRRDFARNWPWLHETAAPPGAAVVAAPQADSVSDCLFA
ncbi:ATP-dependent DNA helicase [Tranquillimonas alkanivorans]|uniref:PIF1-like helicase n=1 Tax=Tranquillimonas alkanivorans TaxID=441119 RepID=A0A1I5WBJ5_9RHOB|nr:DEAD/DEAH box helicase [Tranquillimonas alkanivorans]SFQ17082.1 PIF1-like helicase [Tranquillimonas alkanivorans]